MFLKPSIRGEYLPEKSPPPLLKRNFPPRNFVLLIKGLLEESGIINDFQGMIKKFWGEKYETV